MHNASRGQLLLKLRLRHAIPSLFVGIRISAGIAVIGAITGELFAGSSSVGRGGLGYSIIYASQQLQTDYLFRHRRGDCPQCIVTDKSRCARSAARRATSHCC